MGFVVIRYIFSVAEFLIFTAVMSGNKEDTKKLESFIFLFLKIITFKSFSHAFL